MSYTLPELGYAYDALEPHFDAQTMEIHHSKHHQAYVNNANAVLETLPAEFSEMCAGQLISQLDKIPAEKRTALRNNAGGHANHSLFWKSLKKGTTLQGDLKAAIERDFGSVENFKAEFEKAVRGRKEVAEKDCTEVGLAEKSEPAAGEEIKEIYYGGNTDEILGQRQKTG